MKVIDLLNKIANGEEVPKEIIVRNKTFKWNQINHYYKGIDSGDDLLSELSELFSTNMVVNTEVEIIEEDKTIKELEFDSKEKYITAIEGTSNKMRNIDVTFTTKINELVKEIKKMKGGE